VPALIEVSGVVAVADPELAVGVGVAVAEPIVAVALAAARTADT
jgi:hypothetical protein